MMFQSMILGDAKPTQIALISALWSLSILAVLVLLYRCTIHPLASFPGPTLARFTGLWRTYHYARGTWHDDILKLHKTYGRVVRIAPGELSIVDENAMKQLYGHGKGTRKTRWYHTWDIRGGSPAIFAETDNKTHSFLRRRLANAYSMTNILKYEPYIQENLALLLRKFDTHASRAKPEGAIMNMSDWTNALAFDVVGDLGFGEPLGHLQAESDVMGLRETILQGFWMQANMGHLWGQKYLIDNEFVATIMRLLRVPNPFEKFGAWTDRKVRERREEGQEATRVDMMTYFIGMKDMDGNPASHSEVMMECFNLIGAGADTTSIGMRTCLYFLAGNPNTYRILQEEVDQYYEAQALTEPITYLQTQQLPYLQAVVKEATRLIPSIVYQLLRFAPPGLVVDGHVIPENTHVGISPIAQNRDTAIWGENADEFVPERWLDEAVSRKMDGLSMTFGGSGPRMCIGKNLALVEIQKFIAQVLYFFDFEFANPSCPWKIQSVWFAQQRDFHLRIRKRPGRSVR